MKRVLPAFVIVSGVELGYNVITVLTRAELIYFCTPKFKLDADSFPASGCKVEGEN